MKTSYSYCGFESWLCSELSAKQYVAVKLVTIAFKRLMFYSIIHILHIQFR